MKNILSFLAMFVAVVNLHATVSYSFDSNFSNGGVIPDANQTGWSDTRTITDFNDVIGSLSVTLHLSGGYNGDLYAYLVHGDSIAILLNRVGVTSSNPFGYSDAGMNVTFTDAAGTDIHLYGTLVDGGFYQPDARYVNPLTVTDASTRDLANHGLSVFNGADGNGDWTLFIADMASGDQATLLGWSLEIAPVPEPTTWALIGFALVFVSVKAGRWFRRRGIEQD